MTLRHMPSDDERRAIAVDLWRYGEDDLARRAINLVDHELDRTAEIAGKYAATSCSVRAGVLLSKAIALAVVEVLEGKPRPLARKGGRPLRQSPYRVSSDQALGGDSRTLAQRMLLMSA
jgi:hypothetical protein